jgi:hypothetical protein
MQIRLFLMPLFHGGLANIFEGAIRPKGLLPFRVAKRLSLNEGNELFGLYVALRSASNPNAPLLTTIHPTLPITCMFAILPVRSSHC